MADKKIVDLSALVTQATTDLYETSANGTGSFKETREQMRTYMKNNTVTTSASTHNTSATLTGAEIVGGIVRSTPATSGVTLTLPTASAIYTAMGNTPPVGYYVDCIFENRGLYSISFAAIDPNLLSTGFVSTVILPTQTVSIRFSVTNLTPIQVTIDGGNFLTNNTATLVFVNGINGKDAPDNGSYNFPYKTVSYALTRITDATPSKPYTIVLTGNVNDSGTVHISPNINLSGHGKNISLICNSSITADPAWAAADDASTCSVDNLFLQPGVEVDFSFLTEEQPTVYFNNVSVNPAFILNGYDSGSSAGVYFFLNNCQGQLLSDNAVTKSTGCFWTSCEIGSLTALSGNEFYSYSDWFYSDLSYSVSNVSADNCVFDLNGSVIGTPQSNLSGTNVAMNFDGGSTPLVTLQSCNINRNIYIKLAASMAGDVSLLIFGCNRVQEIFFEDPTGSGDHILLSVDAFSYPKFFTIVAGTPIVTCESEANIDWRGDSNFFGDNTFLGNNSFSGTNDFNAISLNQITSPFVYTLTPADITATTATLTAAQILGGVLTLNPTLAQTLTTPTALQIDTLTGVADLNRGFSVTFINQSAVAAILVAGSDVNTNGCYLTAGNVVIPTLSQREFLFVKTSISPSTYTIYG